MSFLKRSIAKVTGTFFVLFRNDEGYDLLWQTSQQDAHSVPSVRPQIFPHPEEAVRLLRLPRCAHAQVRLVREGPPEAHHGCWSNEAHEDRASPLPTRLPHRASQAEEPRVRRHRGQQLDDSIRARQLLRQINPIRRSSTAFHLECTVLARRGVL